MPFFFEHPEPLKRWPYFPPHKPNVDTTQPPDFDIVGFILFSSCMLSLALLLVYFDRYCRNNQHIHLQEQAEPRQPHDNSELNSFLNQIHPSYGAV